MKLWTFEGSWKKYITMGNESMDFLKLLEATSIFVVE
jgi:hypothetical protein